VARGFNRPDKKFAQERDEDRRHAEEHHRACERGSGLVLFRLRLAGEERLVRLQRKEQRRGVDEEKDDRSVAKKYSCGQLALSYSPFRFQ
jgi:hypothetical protein